MWWPSAKPARTLEASLDHCGWSLVTCPLGHSEAYWRLQGTASVLLKRTSPPQCVECSEPALAQVFIKGQLWQVDHQHHPLLSAFWLEGFCQSIALTSGVLDVALQNTSTHEPSWTPAHMEGPLWAFPTHLYEVFHNILRNILSICKIVLQFLVVAVL